MRDFVALTHPHLAEKVADYVGAVMSGLSSDARGGMSPERLIAVADMAGLAVAEVLKPV